MSESKSNPRGPNFKSRSDDPSRSISALKIKAKLLQKAKFKAGTPIQLKHAFATLAKVAGFSSWRELKNSIEATELFCPVGGSAFWKVWYSSHEEAAKHLERDGVFLLPFRKDFFICDRDYIAFLGVAADDADLARVGNDWARPKDFDAFARLIVKIKAV